VLAEKEGETQELKQKYSELERQFNNMQDQYPGVVNWEAKRLAIKLVGEKDQEIQKLQEQINQLLNQQVMQKTEMEEEPPKIVPERIEIEENKEGEEKIIPPPQGMQTRSQGPPSFGEQIQQEVYDPLGNLTWKGTVYTILNMGDYKAYDVVVNLINHSTGKNKIFKENFANYAREVENDRRTFNNDGYVDKAVEIIEKELNNDKPNIALAMKHILEKNQKTLAGFEKIYRSQYADYLKK